MEDYSKEKLCLVLDKIVQNLDVIHDSQCEMIGSIAQLRDTQHEINNSLLVIKSGSQLDQEELQRLHRRLDTFASQINRLANTQDAMVKKHNQRVVEEYVDGEKIHAKR